MNIDIGPYVAAADHKHGTDRMLPWLCLAYTAASLLHFVHNAEFLDAYPNLPAWITRAGVYGTWIAIATIGLIGYLLFHRGREFIGLAVLAMYACFGFDGLLHYQRAAISAHTAAMNVTIWLEATTAAILLVAVLRCALARRDKGWRVER